MVLPSGENAGVGLEARSGSEPLGHAALPADGPQIAGVREDDLGLVHGRLLHQVQSARSGERGRQSGGQNGK